MPTLRGEYSAVINAPIERVYEVAADPENAPLWQSDIKKATVLERNAAGEQVLVQNDVDVRIKTLTSVLRFNYDDKPTGMSWSQVKGDLKAVDGAWRFTDMGDGTTEATCWMDFDLGRILGMAIRGPVADLLGKQLIEGLPTGLKQYVES
jgi:uncharacterized membrane protein